MNRSTLLAKDSGTPEQQRDGSTVACVTAGHGCECARHGHDEAADEEEAEPDFDPFEEYEKR